jgi:hypothetical protein
MSEDRRAALEQQQAQLIAYAQMKMIARDWHGVADAAMDLREVEARLAELQGAAAEQVNPRDWHGVADAAMDLREVEARLAELQGAAAEQVNPYTSGDVTPVPQCDAVVMGGRCVMVEGHQGLHMNADEWRAEAH